MKRIAIVLLLLCLLLAGCVKPEDPAETTDPTVWLNMNMEYPVQDPLPDVQDAPIKVIILIGQSNATGCSLTSYLEKGVPEETFSCYQQGYPSVLINYSLDDQKYSSQGAFVPVDLSCGAGKGYFGPEVGMAEVLSQEFPNETVYILKFSMSGYSLHHHWLCAGQRGSIYEACMAFLKTHLENLTAHHYRPKIGAICWMQGESDTTDFKASLYLENQQKLVNYLREDLAPYAESDGIYFIDAGISNSPYCEPAYPAVNEAKTQFSKLSPLNLYFSTIDAGFTVHQEPEGDPDWGHYDALSELELGRLFGKWIVKSYEMRE